MTDQDLGALCVWTEAAGEPYEGKVAVARVILNRMAAKYASDGTVPGTVLARDQFSAFWFGFGGGKYTRMCWSVEEAEARAEKLLTQATADKLPWALCHKAVEDAYDGSGFQGGAQWNRLAAEPETFLYFNPLVCRPYWADSDRFVASIYHHDFYRD